MASMLLCGANLCSVANTELVGQSVEQAHTVLQQSQPHLGGFQCSCSGMRAPYRGLSRHNVREAAGNVYLREFIEAEIKL